MNLKQQDGFSEIESDNTAGLGHQDMHKDAGRDEQKVRE